MENDILASLAKLSDAEIIAQTKSLLARDRDTNAQLVARVAELDTRDVHLSEGYSSLFTYCRDGLGMSEWEAYNRIEVARAARRFPVIFGMLADGSLSLTAVRLLAPHLTPANHRDVVESARGKRKLEVQEIVARLSPRPDVPASVRRLLTSPSPVGETSPSPDPAPAPAAQSVPVPPTAVQPLSRDRYKLQLTIAGGTLEKLRLAKDMLGHALPSGDEAAILDRALTLLLADLAKKKFADTMRPGRGRATRPGTRHVSAAVKRAVWVRDLGRCAFIATSGHRCGERRFVEFHHVDPYALGGEASMDLIQLRCRRHNDYEGRLWFGDRGPGSGLVPEQVLPGARHAT